MLFRLDLGDTGDLVFVHLVKVVCEPFDELAVPRIEDGRSIRQQFEDDLHRPALSYS
jgi:hypothetical protein